MLRVARLAAALLASFAAACASPAEVRIDQRKDLAGYCTWNFLSLWDGNVHAPHSDARDLNARLTRSVEKILLERGFVRVTGRPDFFVTLRLEVKRQIVMTSETPAMEHVPSLHAGNESFDIQVAERRVEAYDIGSLAVLVSDPDEEGVIWRGDSEGRYRGEIAPHLNEAVTNLLASLPAPADSPSPCGPQP